MTFSLFEVIIALGLVQGMILAVILWWGKDKNRPSNHVLSFTILFASCMLAGRLIYVKYPDLISMQWYLLLDVVIFLFGPLIYLYTKRLLYSGETSGLPYWHFLPVAGHLTIALYMLSYSESAFHQLLDSGTLTPLYLGIAGTAICLNLLYGILSFRLVLKYKHEEKHQFSFTQNPAIFLKYVLGAIFMVLFLWTFSFASQLFFQNNTSYINFDTVWIVLSFFVYLVAFYSLWQPELFRIPAGDSSLAAQTDRNKEERISSEKQHAIKQNLEELMLREKPYLNSDLTLSKLAELLDESPNNISWILNNVIQQTFYDYINQYRVREFIQKIDNNEHHKKTILGLSQEVGFNSKSTFNRAFRSLMNETPSSFLKNRTQSSHKSPAYE